MEAIWHDLRFSLRTLARSPGFAAMAVLSLALGIGANTAIFSFLNKLLLQPPPVAAPGELARLYTVRTTPTDYNLLSYPDYLDYRDRNRTLAGVAAYRIVTGNIGNAGETQQAWGLMVTGNYFDVLGVKAVLGRTFLPEEDRTEGTHPVVVLSHAYWQKRFGGDPAVVGRKILLNTHPFTVAGVAPPGFHGAESIYLADFFAPILMQPQVETGGSWLRNRGLHMLTVIARRKPDVSLAQAEADLRSISEVLAQTHPAENEGRRAKLLNGVGVIFPDLERGIVFFSSFLMAVIGLVLLLACANIANLLLARASKREREIAIRLALGTSRARLIRQLLTESLLLAALGGAAGVALAAALLQVFAAVRPPIPVPVETSYSIDWRVAAFALGLALVTGLVFGLLPALRASRPDLVTALKASLSEGGFKKSRLRSGLVVAQVALSLVLLAGAGLFLRSLGAAQKVDPGFETEKILMAAFETGNAGYDEVRGRAFAAALTERLTALPGVRRVALTHDVPFPINGGQYTGVTKEGEDPREARRRPNVFYTQISAGYFETLGVELAAGRDFGASDTPDRPRVAIVNEAFARMHWPKDANVTGKRISTRGEKGPFLEIAGVVRDFRNATLGSPARPMIFVPVSQSYPGFLTAVVRVDGDPARLAGAVRGAIRELDPNVPILTLETMPEHLGLSLFVPRVAAAVLSFFGVMALVLASIGVYGVMAFLVSRRTREIGIRMALGASASDVRRAVFREGLTLAGLGLAVGLAGAVALGQAAASLLFGISPADPVALGGVTVLLTLVALLACAVPAQRAMRVDPMVALRNE